MAEKSLVGFWHLPGNPEKKLQGTITYSYESSILLKIVGSFDKQPQSKRAVHEIINGFTVDGKSITLFRCYTSRHSMHMPGMEESVYLVEQLVIGDQFATSPGASFSAITIHFYAIEQWLDLRLIRIDNDISEKSISYFFQWPEPMKFTVDDNVILSIIHEATSQIGGTANNIKLNVRALLLYESKSPFSFDAIPQLVSRIRMLISFFTLRPYFPDEIRVKSMANSENGEGGGSPHWDDFYYNQGADYTQDYGNEDTFSHLKYAMPFPAIREFFPTLIKGWFEKYELLSPIIDSYYLYFYLKETTIEAKFLHVIQAFEAFHRRTIGGNTLSQSEFKARINSIVDRIDPILVPWVKEKLAFAYEPSLKERLLDLLGNSAALGFGETFSEIDALANRIRDSRNYLTHYDDRLRKKMMTPHEMIRVTEQIAEYLLFLIIREIGLDDESIRNLVENARHFRLIDRRV